MGRKMPVIQMIDQGEKNNVTELRRHRARCVYYKEGACNMNLLQCAGSTHCQEYKENDLVTIAKKKSAQRRRRVKGDSLDTAEQIISEGMKRLALGMSVTLHNVDDNETYIVEVVDKNIFEDDQFETHLFIMSPMAKSIEKCTMGEIFELNGCRYRLLNID